jgi:cholesterol transport system auxiliary component
MMKPRLSLLIVAAALPLAGCISFSPKPPPRLMALSAMTPLPAGTTLTTDDKRAVAVAAPSAIPALGTQRVLVTDGATEIAYLKGGLWSAAPAQLFRSLLAETITVKTGRVVPDPRLLTSKPNTRLSGQLSAFGIDGPGFMAVVTFDAALTRNGSEILESRRFTARVPIMNETPSVVAAAVNQAANQVAGDVADWIGK